MGRLKRIITSLSWALTLICFASCIVSAILDSSDFVDVFGGSFIIFLMFSLFLMFWDCSEYDDYEYYYPYSNTEPELNQENKTIVITETRCPACGAPLEDEVCGYCGTRVVIYKTIT